jgi:hypothetical protein
MNWAILYKWENQIRDQNESFDFDLPIDSDKIQLVKSYYPLL